MARVDFLEDIRFELKDKFRDYFQDKSCRPYVETYVQAICECEVITKAECNEILEEWFDDREVFDNVLDYIDELINSKM